MSDSDSFPILYSGLMRNFKSLICIDWINDLLRCFTFNPAASTHFKATSTAVFFKRIDQTSDTRISVQKFEKKKKEKEFLRC